MCSLIATVLTTTQPSATNVHQISQAFAEGQSEISRMPTVVRARRSHFRELNLAWFREGDLFLVTALMVGGSRTLVSLSMEPLMMPIRHRVRTDNLFPFQAGPGPASTDLPETMRLKDASFRVNPWGTDWITTALRTITPR